MKYRSPISLFSFQDIITCLTGIMIVVVLVLLLEVIESAATRAARSALNAERLEVIELEKELIAQVEAARTQLQNAQQELRENRPLTVAALQTRRSELDDRLRQIQEQREEARQNAAELDEKWKKLQLRSTELEQLKKQLEAAKKENQTLHTRLTELRDRFKANEMEWVAGRTPLRIEFVGHFERKPLLFECTGNAILMRDPAQPEKILREFSSNAPTMQTEIDRMIEYLETRSPEREYPVLLVRAEAAGYLEELLNRLRENNWRVGFEPIGTREEIR